MKDILDKAIVAKMVKFCIERHTSGHEGSEFLSHERVEKVLGIDKKESWHEYASYIHAVRDELANCELNLCLDNVYAKGYNIMTVKGAEKKIRDRHTNRTMSFDMKKLIGRTVTVGEVKGVPVAVDNKTFESFTLV